MLNGQGRSRASSRGPVKKLYKQPTKPRRQSSRTRYSVDNDENDWIKAKVRKINAALDADPVDIRLLQELAISEYGFVTDDIRCRVWPKLLNVNVFDLPKRKGADLEQKDFKENKYYNQVKLDINRSHRRFPSGTRVSRRRVLQHQLNNVVMRVLCRNQELHYYQGYHDIAVTLLRVVGEDLAVALLEQLSLHHIRADVGQIFALSWLITWFGHNLEKFNVIVRLFDVFMATNPIMPVYLGSAIIASDATNILQLECEMSTVHSYLTKLPNNLILDEIEYLISKAHAVLMEFPPHMLEKAGRKVIRERSEQLVEKSLGQKPDAVLRKRTRQGYLVDAVAQLARNFIREMRIKDDDCKHGAIFFSVNYRRQLKR
eukprot:gene19008-20920_t